MQRFRSRDDSRGLVCVLVCVCVWKKRKRDPRSEVEDKRDGGMEGGRTKLKGEGVVRREV
jgi:hypothetical protein